MPNLNIRLSEPLHTQLMSHCRARGSVASALVRSLIESLLSGQSVASVASPPPVIEPLAQVHPTRGGGRLVNITIRLTESEHEAIRLRKRLHGCTKTAWIVRTIRSALTRAPVLDEEQTEAIKHSNYQLLALGKNINQIARRLNERQDSQARALELEQLETIRANIDVHVSRVEALMATITERGALS